MAKVADTPDHETAGRLKDEIKALLKEKNAVLVAHYYVDPLIQDLALETGGCVGDSLEMARFGAEHGSRYASGGWRALHGRERENPLS